LFEFEGNKSALGFVKLLAEGHMPSTVLYIYGPHGSGKSEMLRQAESFIYEHNPSKNVSKIALTPTEDLYWNYSPLEIKSMCSDSDYLFIDDVQHISYTESGRYGLLSAIENMQFLGKKLIITSDRSVEMLATRVSPDLAGRLMWELPVSIKRPTIEDCRFALKKTANEAGLSKCKDIEAICDMIVSAEGDNLGVCLGTLRRIVVRAELLGNPITVNFADSVLYEGREIELLA